MSRQTIQTYIDLCKDNYPQVSDSLLIFAVSHYLEIELNGTNQIIERTGDQDTIKFQPLGVSDFWDLTASGRTFKQLMRRGRSFQHVRPSAHY